MLKILIFEKPLKLARAWYSMIEVSGHNLWSNMGYYLGMVSCVFLNIQ